MSSMQSLTSSTGCRTRAAQHGIQRPDGGSRPHAAPLRSTPGQRAVRKQPKIALRRNAGKRKLAGERAIAANVRKRPRKLKIVVSWVRFPPSPLAEHEEGSGFAPASLPRAGRLFAAVLGFVAQSSPNGPRSGCGRGAGRRPERPGAPTTRHLPKSEFRGELAAGRRKFAGEGRVKASNALVRNKDAERQVGGIGGTLIQDRPRPGLPKALTDPLKGRPLPLGRSRILQSVLLEGGSTRER